MHARLAAILSVTGVLVAGGAAAVVNSEVLGNESGTAAGTGRTTPSSVVVPRVVRYKSWQIAAWRRAEGRPVAVGSAGSSTSTSTTTSTTTSTPTTTPTTTSTSTSPTTSTTAPAAPTDPSTSTAAPAAIAAPATTTPSVTAAPVPGSATQGTYRLGDAATAVLDTADGQLTIVTVTPNPGWTLVLAQNDGPTTVVIQLESTEGGTVDFSASLVHGVVVVSLDCRDRSDGDFADLDPEGPATTDESWDDDGSGEWPGPAGDEQLDPDDDDDDSDQDGDGGQPGQDGDGDWSDEDGGGETDGQWGDGELFDGGGPQTGGAGPGNGGTGGGR